MAPGPREVEVRLNLGCGGRPLPGYVNVDMDSREQLQARYPSQTFPEDLPIYNYDIFHLPYADGTVSEIRTDSLVEHLSFLEEPKFFYEVKRVLKPGGLFQFETVNFEEAVKLWLAAKDDWKDFFRNDPEAIASQHWFGNGSYALDNRWGYMTAMFFGSQNGEGQYHKNCYTVGKVQAMLKRLGFADVKITHFRWKGDRDPMIHVEAIKGH